jgi:hypothetical protein
MAMNKDIEVEHDHKARMIPTFEFQSTFNDEAVINHASQIGRAKDTRQETTALSVPCHHAAATKTERETKKKKGACVVCVPWPKL